MKRRNIIIAARILSALFTPFYLPILGLIALFMFSYMSLLPVKYKLFVLMVVYLFTILLPTLLIHFYRRYQGWSLIELGIKERRMVPYIISILCYFFCFYLMTLLHIALLIRLIVIIAFVIQVVCAFINIWWKISTHTAAIGGIASTLVAYSIGFGYDPTWWFCLLLLIGGLVGTARMILRQHSLGQVVCGFVAGIMAAAFTIYLY